MADTPTRVRNALKNVFGAKGRFNAAAWCVAGTLAYVLWIRPAREEEEMRRVRMLADVAAADGRCLLIICRLCSWNTL